LRLLLDEQYTPAIAEHLRDRGHDATAVKAEPDLRGLDDDPLLRAATADRRALMTNNVRDFVRLAREWQARGDEHYGLIFTDNTIGRFVEALDILLRAHPADDALRNRVHWLT
jgi:predicted nuclease of predicted toxin-antitoxin system